MWLAHFPFFFLLFASPLVFSQKSTDGAVESFGLEAVSRGRTQAYHYIRIERHRGRWRRFIFSTFIFTAFIRDSVEYLSPHRFDSPLSVSPAYTHTLPLSLSMWQSPQRSLIFFVPVCCSHSIQYPAFELCAPFYAKQYKKISFSLPCHFSPYTWNRIRTSFWCDSHFTFHISPKYVLCVWCVFFSAASHPVAEIEPEWERQMAKIAELWKLFKMYGIELSHIYRHTRAFILLLRRCIHLFNIDICVFVYIFWKRWKMRKETHK